MGVRAAPVQKDVSEIRAEITMGAARTPTPGPSPQWGGEVRLILRTFPARGLMAASGMTPFDHPPHCPSLSSSAGTWTWSAL